MAQEWAAWFYRGKAWKDCRRSFIGERVAIDGGMCQKCGQELGYIVHHRERLTPENINDPDVSLNHKKLEYVCHRCHQSIDSGGREPDRYYFDVDGQIVPLPPIN